MSGTSEPASRLRLERQVALIAARWPALATMLASTAPLEVRHERDGGPRGSLVVDGIHLGSSWNPREEARRQAGLIPEASGVAWVYGIGCGELPRQLLARRQLAELNLVIMNLRLLATLLRHYDFDDWLGDQRTRLHLGSDLSHPSAPLCAVPPCLTLAEEGAAALRDRVQLELDSPLINRRVARVGEEDERLRRNLLLVEQDGDVATLFNSQPGSCWSVVGAGPGLDSAYSYLALPQPIIVVDRALRLLLERGIRPQIVVSIDPDPFICHLLAVDQGLASEITLAYAPMIPEEAIANWPGPRLAFYGNSPLYEPLQAITPRGVLFQSGSVIHPAVDLAVRIGARRLLLFGADFAMPAGKSHANGNRVTPHGAVVAGRDQVAGWHGQPLATLPNLRGYLRDLESYLALQDRLDCLCVGQQGARIAGCRSFAPDRVVSRR